MDRLEATGNFERDRLNSIRLHHRGGMLADLIPFGDLATEQGEVHLTRPSVLTLDIPVCSKWKPELSVTRSQIEPATLVRLRVCYS